MSRYRFANGELYRRIYTHGFRPVDVARKLKVAPSVLSRINSGECEMTAELYARVLNVIRVRRTNQ